MHLTQIEKVHESNCDRRKGKYCIIILIEYSNYALVYMSLQNNKKCDHLADMEMVKHAIT